MISAKLADWPRILPTKHRATPAGAGYGSSRYSSPTDAFRVLYAAIDFPTAFAEAVVRDRFEGKTRRYLYRPHLEQVCLTAVSSARELTLLDLRGAGAYELGVNTDASRAREHRVGQTFSQSVHSGLPEVDAILFDSRLTTGACVAIYDRAFPALSATVPIALMQAALLPAEITRLNIVLRRERGYAP
ncbi:RES family NAD+ phosphorylase [uncultured Caulobacter sp.]|uniref:RES family NAD+ phosphorylase n=1 Tax=uncultured Caulobacter sp. TaxID=158749 RepID=UPI0026192316|nr:RES family NAD+ phosphorylase [uncultured Caulobacter sp.]